MTKVCRLGGFFVLASLLATPAAALITEDICSKAKAYNTAHAGLSLLILEDGVPVCQDNPGRTAESAFDIHSGSKSFIGIMAAVAVKDHLLGLDDLAADTITEWQADPIKSKVTIRHLLSMTSGLPSEIGNVPTFQQSLKIAFNASPGERFQYGPAPFQVFGEIMRRKLTAAGQSPDPYDYLKRKILDPVGINIVDWLRGIDGQLMMPRGAVIAASQWAKFGEFVRRGGRQDGELLVDPAAFEALFQGSKANPAYGLSWWLPKATPSRDQVTALNDVSLNPEKVPDDLVMANGAGHQMLYVIPSLKLTIVRQAKFSVLSVMRQAYIMRLSSDWSNTDFLRIILNPQDNPGK